MTREFALIFMALTFVIAACKDDPKREATSGGESEEAARDGGRCPNPGDDDRELEASVYDTSGDGVPDVRKVYLVVRTGPDPRLVLICREVDLSRDGRKDMVRHYDESGSPSREESDRNFDGEIDSVTHFDAGRIVKKELDSDFDGRFDTKIFYEGGAVIRTERDLAGRDPDAFRTDRWEYVEDGRIVRIGIDIDGDGQVDRWERDEDAARARRERERREAAERDEEDSEDGESAEDGSAEEEPDATEGE